MNKLNKLKQAIKNPPPERLAAVEYKSHFMQMLGISAVCIILIAKGLWYIIFAFIFGLGISYSQGMTAYQKYKAIMSLRHPERIEDFERDISFTRRRSKIVQSVIGKWGNFVSIIIAVAGAVLIIDPFSSRWLLMLLYPITIAVGYFFVHFFILYWICYPIYKKKLRGE